MPDDPTDANAYTWLPIAKVKTWLKLADTSPKLANAEVCRQGACSWIEDQRPDIFKVDPLPNPLVVPDRVVSAALLAVARLFSRIDSPNGTVTFEELGAGTILPRDPDVKRMLGFPRPKVG